MPRVPPRAPRLLACVILTAAVALVGSTARASQTDTQPGELLYGRDCASCHGPEGEGTSRGVPLLDSGAAAADFYLSTGRMPIDEPDDEIRRGDTPYSDAQIDALVEFVAALGDGPPIPRVDDGGDVAAGGSLYRLHCAQCHGATGVGVALAAGVTAPEVLASTPTEVAEALVVGPGAMPSFTPGVLSDADVESVVRYVELLADPPDRGGHPLARSGRLDELLVAWGVGVLAVAAFARAIARRR